MEEMFKDDLDQQPMARLLSASADITSSREPIAIIGMGCHFPGANSPEDFWQLLCNEVDAITEVPADRFPIDAFYDPRPGLVGKTVTRWGGFLDGIDQFDASFFGISPHAASRMDPQYRLLLEVAWEALEDDCQDAHGSAKCSRCPSISEVSQQVPSPLYSGERVG